MGVAGRVGRISEGVYVWGDPWCYVLFKGQSVQSRPWPPSPELTALVSVNLDDLVDAGVSQVHPFLVDCTTCDAKPGMACTHLRTGEAIHGWHSGRKL